MAKITRKRKYAGVDFKYIFTHGIEIECDDLLSFVQTMAGGLQSEMREFESFLDRVTEGLDETRKNEAIEHYADDAFGVMDRYPRILWQSVFISLYSFFEQEMNGICRRVRREADKKGIPKTKVPKQTGVTLPAQKCLLEFKIRLAMKSAEWKRMTAYVGVRNLIVHNRGQLRKNDDESERVKQFVRYAKYLTLDHSNTLVLEREFCVAMIETMRAVLIKTIAAIPNKLFQG